MGLSRLPACGGAGTRREPVVPLAVHEDTRFAYDFPGQEIPVSHHLGNHFIQIGCWRHRVRDARLFLVVNSVEDGFVRPDFHSQQAMALKHRLVQATLCLLYGRAKGAGGLVEPKMSVLG